MEHEFVGCGERANEDEGEVGGCAGENEVGWEGVDLAWVWERLWMRGRGARRMRGGGGRNVVRNGRGIVDDAGIVDRGKANDCIGCVQRQARM